MREALNSKLSQTNSEYGAAKRLCSGMVGIYDKMAYKAYEFLLARRLNREEGKKDGK